MKVIPTVNRNYDASLRKNNLSTQPSCLANEVSKDSVSFGASLKGGVVKTFDWIDKKGFLVDFLIVDALSMITPRILIGLSRDKEKTGKLNYKAGAEEAGRELFSGPSMMLIPMAVLAGYKKYVPASNISRDTLKGLTQNMTKVVDEAADTKMFTSSEQLNKNLADKLFDDAFVKFDLDNRSELRSEFSRLLNESTKSNPKSKIRARLDKLINSKPDEFRDAADKFEKHIILINNNNKATQPLDTKRINLEAGKVGATDLFEDFHNYSKDVVEKFTKKDFAKGVVEKCKENAKEFLTDTQKTRSNTKSVTAITAFLTVGAFLLYLPRFYQRGKVSPAMESAKRAREEGSVQGGANENK